MQESIEYLLFSCAWLGIALGYWLTYIDSKKESLVISFWKLHSYYTVLTNLLVAVSISCVVFLPGSSWGLFFQQPSVAAAIALYIFSVGVANYTLFGWPKLAFWHSVSDTLVHGITPALAFIYWLACADKTGLNYTDIVYWLIYPISYAIYTAVHGIWSEFYPYPFTNVNELGWQRVGLNALGLAGAVIITSAALITATKIFV